jgi:hypothetical protein
MLVVGNVYPCNTGHALTPDSLINWLFFTTERGANAGEKEPKIIS